MGLNKYAGKWEDISGWTTERVESEIAEIHRKADDAVREFADYIKSLSLQFSYIMLHRRDKDNGCAE